MGLLFRDGDTRNAKLVNLAFMALSGVALVGLLDSRNLVPHPTLKPWAVATGFVVVAYMMAVVNKDRNPASRFGVVAVTALPLKARRCPRP